MGLKILDSADWHLDSPFAAFSESQRSLLKAEQKKLPGLITDLCIRENCDMMLLSGDLFDGTPARATLELVKKALKESGVPVLISPGNHDFCGPDSPWTEENWPENVYIFTGGMECVTISGLDCRIYGAGYRSMDCEPLLEDFRAEGEETYKLAVMHGDAQQRNSPYNPITTAQVRASGLNYLALGHIHKAGAFRAGETLCVWPGCPMGRGWDETGEKGVCIVTLGEDPQVQPVMLDTVHFYDMEVDIGLDPVEALETVLPGSESNDFYRISLTGYGNVDLEALKAYFAYLPNLELRDRTEVCTDLWEAAGEDTLEGIYFQMLRKTMADDPENADAIRLAAEISRKILSGKEVSL